MVLCTRCQGVLEPDSCWANWPHTNRPKLCRCARPGYPVCLHCNRIWQPGPAGADWEHTPDGSICPDCLDRIAKELEYWETLAHIDPENDPPLSARHVSGYDF